MAQLTDPTFRQYIPELETVSTGGMAMRAIAIIGWVLLSLIAGALCGGVYALIKLLLIHGQFILSEFIVASIIGAVFAALMMIRSSQFDYYWATDKDGLTIHGLFRKKRILWSDVIEANGRSGTGEMMICTLRTASSKIAITDMLAKNNAGLMGASIFQHLNRIGKGNTSLLSASARTFWMPIPDEVPKEMDWYDPKPPNWAHTLGIAAIIIIAVSLIIFLKVKLHWKDLWSNSHQIFAALIPLGYYKFSEVLTATRSVEVRNDGIEMRTAYRTIYLQWADVGYVYWNLQHKSLAIGRKASRDVGLIRYRTDDPSSAHIILAIIRHLRLAHHNPPVAIPQPLRYMAILPLASSPTRSYVNDKSSYRIRNTGRLKTLFVGIMVAIGTTGLLISNILPRTFLTVLLIGSVWAVIYSMQEFFGVYTADDVGISYKTLSSHKQVKWSEIGSCKVTWMGLTKQCKYVLKDVSGRTLLILNFYDNAGGKDDEFIRYIDSHLVSVRQDDNAPRLMR